MKSMFGDDKREVQDWMDSSTGSMALAVIAAALALGFVGYAVAGWLGWLG